MKDPISGLMKSISTEVMNLKDEAIRAALAKLGWIAPQDVDESAETPEADRNTGLSHDINALCETSRRLERQRDELRNALRDMHEAKGRHNTMIAMQKLIALLPPE